MNESLFWAPEEGAQRPLSPTAEARLRRRDRLVTNRSFSTTPKTSASLEVLIRSKLAAKPEKKYNGEPILIETQKEDILSDEDIEFTRESAALQRNVSSYHPVPGRKLNGQSLADKFCDSSDDETATTASNSMPTENSGSNSKNSTPSREGLSQHTLGLRWSGERTPSPRRPLVPTKYCKPRAIQEVSSLDGPIDDDICSIDRGLSPMTSHANSDLHGADSRKILLPSPMPSLMENGLDSTGYLADPDSSNGDNDDESTSSSETGPVPFDVMQRNMVEHKRRTEERPLHPRIDSPVPETCEETVCIEAASDVKSNCTRITAVTPGEADGHSIEDTQDVHKCSSAICHSCRHPKTQLVCTDQSLPKTMITRPLKGTKWWQLPESETAWLEKKMKPFFEFLEADQGGETNSRACRVFTCGTSDVSEEKMKEKDPDLLGVPDGPDAGQRVAHIEIETVTHREQEEKGEDASRSTKEVATDCDQDDRYDRVSNSGRESLQVSVQ